MKKCIRLTCVLAFLCVAMCTAMFAAENSYLYLVQGIPGHDYTTTTDPQFPVDVLLNDEVCYVHGLAFGTIAGPLTLAPGTYDVKISVANSLAPCTNSPILDNSVTLESGKNVSAVFSLGQTGTPALATFSNNFATVAANMARVLIAHAADAPTVQVSFQNTTTKQNYTYTVNPGELLIENLPAATYTVQVNQGTTTLVPPTTLDLISQTATLFYAVGTASNNTVNLENKIVKNVI